MEFRHLETFRSVVEQGSFTGAAKKLNTTQSNVSLRVAELERELGVTLVDRTRRKARVTPKGRDLLRYASQLALLLDELRNTVGRVSDVTWSKVQSSASAVLESQAYALRELSDLADKLEEKARVDELAKVARQAERDVRRWLAVLARCVQLHDAIAVLELDRVLESAPDELDRHRLGLAAARDERLHLLGERMAALLERMAVAAETANSKVLFNPRQSPAVVKASNSVAAEVHEFRVLLEIESGEQSTESRRWRDAAGEQWAKVREVSGDGMEAVKGAGTGTKDHVVSATGKLSEKARGAGSAGIESAKSLGAGATGKARSLKGRLTSRRRPDETAAGAAESAAPSEDVSPRASAEG